MENLSSVSSCFLQIIYINSEFKSTKAERSSLLVFAVNQVAVHYEDIYDVFCMVALDHMRVFTYFSPPLSLTLIYILSKFVYYKPFVLMHF